MQEIWTAVDEYVTGALVSEDTALEAAVKESQAAGLPAIAVSPPQGKLLTSPGRWSAPAPAA
jgi:hypothetical protein